MSDGPDYLEILESTMKAWTTPLMRRIAALEEEQAKSALQVKTLREDVLEGLVHELFVNGEIEPRVLQKFRWVFGAKEHSLRFTLARQRANRLHE